MSIGLSFFSRQNIISSSSLGEGRQHHLELIELNDHSKWVCKKFYAQTWLGQVEESNLELTEELAAAVAVELGISFAAYKKNNKFVFTVDGQKSNHTPLLRRTSNRVNQRRTGFYHG